MNEDIYSEGFIIGVAGGRRSDNPYAKGWARFSALVLPESPAAIWNSGFEEGLKVWGKTMGGDDGR